MLQDSQIPTFPPDPLFHLQEEFSKDPREVKINLGIGAYQTAKGKPYLFTVVHEAEKCVLEKESHKAYLPIMGSPLFQENFLKKFFPTSSLSNLWCGQSLGGTGALFIIGRILHLCGINSIALSTPTWINHLAIFENSGLQSHSYRYYDKQQQKLLLNEAIEDLSSTKGAVLFQATCHNPTGLDPTESEWQTLIDHAEKQGLYLVFDLAYHGFKEPLDRLPFPISYALKKQLPFLLAYSFSKNLGLYGERLGAIISYHPSSKTNEKLQGVAKKMIRSTYSNPPRHPSLIAYEILNSPPLIDEWFREMHEIKSRIKEVRQTLSSSLKHSLGENYFDFIQQQNGMFSIMGLSPEEVENLKTREGIYLPSSSRINLAGLTPDNLAHFVNAITKILKTK